MVVQKATAEEQYEDAITDGDAAIMLEQVEPGLYNMNVGNILPGEEIAISFTYAELYLWQGETLRFFLPTTLAPRYGDIEGAGLQPHQTPEYDLLVEHPFQFRLTLLGILADAALDSPTHQLTIEKTTGKAVITSATGEDVMDRDFILNISSNQTEKDAALIEIERIEGLPGTIARLAIHEALADENEADAAQLALQYKLVSPYTNYLVVAVRAEGEKAQDLPALRKMPQMLAAGWGGSSSVVQERVFTPQVMFSLAPNREAMHRRRQQTKPDHFASMCNQRHTQWLRPVLQVTSYHDLLGCDLPDRILNAIEAIAKLYDSEVPEELIVVAFLHALTLSALAGEFNRNVRRAIRKAYKNVRPDERLTRLMAEAFFDIRPDDWGPRFNGEDYAEQEAVDSHE